MTIDSRQIAKFLGDKADEISWISCMEKGIGVVEAATIIYDD